MEQRNGHFDVMESRLQCGGLRQKSKVPRARGPHQQRPDYAEYTLSSPLKNHHIPSSRSHQPSPRDQFSSPKDHIPSSRDHIPFPRDHLPSPREHHSSSRDHQGMLHLGDTDEQKEWRRLVGQRVCISGVKQGTLRYFGRTNFAQGHWCGVELDEPVGKNDGTVGGVVYFACRPNHGIFAPVGKVSKLNDTWIADSARQEDSKLNDQAAWKGDSIQQEASVHHSQYRHSSGFGDYDLEESSEKKFIRNSISDPTFMQGNVKPAMPRCSESFSFDEREFAETSRNYAKTQSVVKNSSSSRSLSKYGYTKKNQYFGSNVINLGESGREINPRHAISQSSSLTTAMEEYEQFLRTPTNSGQVSPMSSAATTAKRFNEMPFYDYGKTPDAFLSAFQSHDFSDFEDEVDNDDHMSVDYDESLGILTPSQMKDLTLGADFPTSLSDIRGMDFPSSESFDDINDLPEDEQVHDVSVFRVSESSTIRNVEVSKQSGSGNYSKTFTVASEDKGQVSSTDKFLCSISQKDREGFNVDSRFTSTAEDDFRLNSSEDYDRTYKITNMSAANALCSDKNSNLEKEISEKYYKSFSKEESSNLSRLQSNSVLTSGASFTRCSEVKQSTMEIDQKSSEYCNQSDSSKSKEMTDNEDISRKNCDLDSSRESPLPVESESNATLKEKLTVSWEDCLSRNSDGMFPHVERPESVYTVGSSDTGFQEDGEMEGDTGMTTSMDSTDETKRFSTASRDSCIVSDEVDVYKIAESNSTSGYSTGLSDSCCNDRPEDDLSSKPLTDEEIQDSVEHCDSEDAFSFQENSLGKDGDIVNMETSEVTTENVTALINNDSTSDALCETMVEDSTLTEINELLLSPEDNRSSKSPVEAKETNVPVEQPKDGTKTYEKNEPSPCINSPAQSTPERRLNPIRAKTVQTRNASNPGTNRASRTSREEDLDKKRQQSLVVKSPKKNVMSKIKAMIEATSCKGVGRSSKSETEPVVPRRTVSAPKKSRWEAVTSKIAASLAEEKTKPKAKREIKSRVDTNLTLARQQQVICKSPKLDSCRVSNCGDGSMSPVSVCSRDRRTHTDKNSAPSSVREGRATMSRDSKQRPKSPRHLHRLLSLMAGCAPVCRMTYVVATPPGPGRITSRSASPVAASESSTTSASFNSHNSRSKIAHWKGSNSTIASSVPPPPVIKRPPAATTKTTSTTRATPAARMVTKKPPTVPKIRITPSERSQSPAPSSRNERNKRHSRTTKEQTGGRGSHLTSKPVRPPMWLSKAELTQEIQQLGNLCEARTKELNRLKMETKHVTVGFDAFAALFKYMVEDLNGLSVPMLSEDLGKTLKQLELAKQDLAYYEREVEEMKAHHCQELNDLSNKLFEVFQGEVTELGSKHQEEINRLKLDHEQQIKATTETFKASCEDTQAAHEAVVMRLQQELISQREELQLFHENELVELEEKYSQSTKTLHEHIEQLQKKCAELKHHSMGMEDAMRKDTDTKLQWVTSRKGDLEKEVESLKAVLEMKNKELHTLRVQNLEMEKQLEELPLAREKIKMLSARAEDLEALMIEKTKLERKLSTENQVIKDTYEKESKVNKRLSMENEELQWRLRQAEHSLLSGSFSEVLEYPEDAENGAISPVKSPPQMSRSVFFTYVDKEDTSSPRSQYKKITPGFSSGYKTSPSKSSKSPPAPSPRRGRGQSEPIQPPCSTPKKSGKTISLKQKRQRATTDSGSVQSFAGSMASSVGSECSVFDQKEGLLEEHKEQIIESLEILREQRFSEENDSEPIPPNDSELPTPNDIDSKWLEDTTKQHGQSVSFEGDQVMKSLDIFHEKRSPGENDGEPITPNEKWQDDVKHNGERLTFAVDEMSRSSEFSDPKTYYHMTFPVLKDAGSPGCDTEDIRKVENHNGIVAQPTHSIEGSNVIHMSEKVSLEATNVSSQEGATTKVESEEVAQHAFVSCHNVRDLEYNGQSREKNRWRTM